MELAKLKLKACSPVGGIWFSPALAVTVGIEEPLGGDRVGKVNMSESRVVGGPSLKGSGGSSGPLKIVKLGALATEAFK